MHHRSMLMVHEFACGGLNCMKLASLHICLCKCFFLFQVNENFAIDLIAEQPVSEVQTRVIACDGGGGALGHPKVYINLVRSQPPRAW